MTYQRLLQLLSLAGAVAVLGGCSPEGKAAIADAAEAASRAQPITEAVAANLVTVTATDFSFKAPGQVPAGLTTIRLVNKGPELHHVQLVKLKDGHTLKEFLDRVAAGELVPAWVEYVGGPNTPVPGGATETTLNLEAGSYAMVCIIPSRDGVPHLMKGMVAALQVTRSGNPTTLEPRADVRMDLVDYAFPMSASLAAGHRTIRVENKAEQPHEVVLAQLAPGKTAQDLMHWLHEQKGPPPGKPIGGTTVLTQGEVNFVTADFAPGEYALLCMVPDAKDGQPHVAHGMVHQITVK